MKSDYGASFARRFFLCEVISSGLDDFHSNLHRLSMWLIMDLEFVDIEKSVSELESV